MQIKTLANIDFTDDQLKGLAIENARMNQRRVESGASELSDEQDLARRVVDIVDDLAERNIFHEERRRINEAVRAAGSEVKSAVAQALNVDLTIDVPAVSSPLIDDVAPVEDSQNR